VSKRLTEIAQHHWTPNNRTGMARARDRNRMRESAEGFVPVGNSEEFRRMRMSAREGAPPIGTVPPPASLAGTAKQALQAVRGKNVNVLMDKLGERLAFERTGVRLYDALIEKLRQSGSFDGGPNVEALSEIRDDELEHFRTVARALADLDGDPTAMTPSADLAGVVSSGVVKAVTDARTTLKEGLEAILVAELADGDAWARLIELTEQIGGQDELVSTLRAAATTEARHLEQVRRWVVAAAAARAD